MKSREPRGAWAGPAPRRPSRAALSLVEVTVAVAVVATLMLVLIQTMVSGHREVVRDEDLVGFQSAASMLLDAASREPFEFILEEAPESSGARSAAWTAWQDRVLGPTTDGVDVAVWKEPSSDRDIVLLRVVVRWGSPERASRPASSCVRLGRVLTRPSASLAMEVRP